MSGFDLSKIPSQAPPPGVTSNFENPYSLAVLPRGFIYATLPPMVLFLGLRFYTRIKITRQVGIDDCQFVPTLTSESGTERALTLLPRSLCCRGGKLDLWPDALLCVVSNPWHLGGDHRLLRRDVDL